MTAEVTRTTHHIIINGTFSFRVYDITSFNVDEEYGWALNILYKNGQDLTIPLALHDIPENERSACAQQYLKEVMEALDGPMEVAE